MHTHTHTEGEGEGERQRERATICWDKQIPERKES